jgi:hypothetical protein
MQLQDVFNKIQQEKLVNKIEQQNKSLTQELNGEELNVVDDLFNVNAEIDKAQEQEDEADNEIQQGKKVIDEDNEEIKTNLIYELKNIAGLIPEYTRQSIAKDVMDNLDRDKDSREQWLDNIREAKEQFNIRTKEDSRSSDNQVAEGRKQMSSDKSYALNNAVIKVTATLSAIFLGDEIISFTIKEGTAELKNKALKLKNLVNQYFNNAIPNYKADKRNSFYDLSLEGNVYQKIYFDSLERKLDNKYLPAIDIEVNPYSRSADDATRLAQRVHMNKFELDAKIDNKDFLEYNYRPIGSGYGEDDDDHDDDMVDTSEDRDDNIYEFYQVRVRYKLNDFGDLGDYKPPAERDLPYLIDIDVSSGRIAAIYEFWESDDRNFKTIQNFVKSAYFPNSESWNWGLLHLAAPLVKSSTNKIRMISNAGAYSSHPTVLVNKAIKNTNTTQVLFPGSLIPIDTGGNFKLSEQISPIPFPQASPSLSELMQYYEQGVDQITLNLTNMSGIGPNTPASSIMMQIEEASKISNFIISGIYDALTQEYKIFLTQLKKYAHLIDPQYMSFEFRELLNEFDFNDPNIIITPTANSKASSQYIDMIINESLLNLSDKYSQINVDYILRNYVTNLGLNPDEILKPEAQITPMTPMMETASLMASLPVKAFRNQDQESYILALQAFMNSLNTTQDLAPEAKQPILNNATMLMAQRKFFDALNKIEAQIKQGLKEEGASEEEIAEFKLPEEISELDSDILNQIALMEAQTIAQDQQQQQEAAAQTPPPLDPNQVMQNQVEVEAQKVQIDAQAIEQRAQTDNIKAQTDLQKAQIVQQTTLQKAMIDREKEIEKANIAAKIKLTEISSKLQQLQ